MVRIIYLILAGALATGLIAGCQSTEEYLQLRKPTARLINVQFREADVYGATLVFDVQVENHYAAELPLLRFDYSLSSRGERFLADSSELQIRIPAYERRTILLPARVDYPKALRALSGAREGAVIPYDAELDLTVNTPQFGRITLPMGKSGELVLPKVSDVKT